MGLLRNHDSHEGYTAEGGTKCEMGIYGRIGQDYETD